MATRMGRIGGAMVGADGELGGSWECASLPSVPLPRKRRKREEREAGGMGRSHGGVNAEKELSHKCGMAIRLRLFHARPVHQHHYLQRALILLIVAVSAYWAVAASPPNIVYILCDDLGYGDVRV